MYVINFLWDSRLKKIISLQLISEEIAELQHNHATTMAKLAQFKRKHLELSHSILQVLKSCHTQRNHQRQNSVN